MKKVQVVPKVIGKRYVVKVNNQPVYVAEKRKEAFEYVAKMNLDESIKDVTVVNETISEKVIRRFETKTNAITLVASELGPELE